MISLFLNNALFVFGSDGTYEKMISYPRESASGDGTYYLDQDKDIIYMVQGYQVIAIDVEPGEVKDSL